MRTISSKWTDLQRFVGAPFMIFLFGLAAWFIIREPSVSLPAKCFTVILWGGISYYLWHISWSFANVTLGEKVLIATRGKTTAIVPLHTIKDVRQNFLTRKILRAYPNRPVERQVMMPKAKWSMAR